MSEEATPPCPRLEEIAALLDRRLVDPARQELLDHLANCERCYAVFASTSESLAELSAPAGRGLTSTRHRGWVAAGLGLASVAALALWCSAPFTRSARSDRSDRPDRSSSSGRMHRQAAALDLAASLLGAPVDDEPSGEPVAIDRLAPGALEMRLALALAEGRRDDASQLASELGRRLGGQDAALFSDLAAELRAARPAVPDWPPDLIERRFGARRGVEARCAQAILVALGRGVPNWLDSAPGIACREQLKLPATTDPAVLADLLEPRIQDPNS